MAELSNSRKAGLLLALLLTATVLAVGAISAQRKIERFQPLGFEARAEAGHWLVASAQSSGAGEFTIEGSIQLETALERVSWGRVKARYR